MVADVFNDFPYLEQNLGEARSPQSPQTIIESIVSNKHDGIQKVPDLRRSFLGLRRSTPGLGLSVIHVFLHGWSA